MAKAKQAAAKRKRTRRGKGRPTDPKLAVGAETIVEETCKLLSQMPPAKVTRAAVARAAGVDPSLIRYYFKNRSLLLLAAFEKLTGEYRQYLAEESEKYDPTPRGQLCARVSALFRLNTTYPYYHDLLIEEIVPMKEKTAQEFFADMQDRRVSAYRDIVNRGVADGSFREVDVELLFMIVIGMCHFFSKGAAVLQGVKHSDTIDPALQNEYHDLICELLIKGLDPQN
jgi:AcrR family transcriptional regulator